MARFGILAAGVVTALAALTGTSAFAKECKAASERSAGSQFARSLGASIGSSLMRNALGRAGISDYYGVSFTLNAYLIDSFACALDKQEQKKAEEATKAVLDAPADTSEKVEWVSETNEGVSGSVEATPVVVSDNGRECRTATQIGYVDGKEIRATPTFCRAKGSSNWVAQTA